MLRKRSDTLKSRLESRLMPLGDQPRNYKNLQKQYASMEVGKRGVTSKFIGRSQIRDILPLAYSDYIYAIIIEEMGLFGGLIIIIFFLVLMFRVLNKFRDCGDLFGGFMMLGLMILILFQALINMAVGVGLFPVTGQPLPLLSRGGSSMLITSGYFGIIQSISRCVMENEEIKQQHLRKVEEGIGYFDENGDYNEYENVDTDTGEILNYTPDSEQEYFENDNNNIEIDTEREIEVETEESENEIYRY